MEKEIANDLFREFRYHPATKPVCTFDLVNSYLKEYPEEHFDLTTFDYNLVHSTLMEIIKREGTMELAVVSDMTKFSGELCHLKYKVTPKKNFIEERIRASHLPLPTNKEKVKLHLCAIGWAVVSTKSKIVHTSLLKMVLPDGRRKMKSKRSILPCKIRHSHGERFFSKRFKIELKTEHIRRTIWT